MCNHFLLQHSIFLKLLLLRNSYSTNIQGVMSEFQLISLALRNMAHNQHIYCPSLWFDLNDLIQAIFSNYLPYNDWFWVLSLRWKLGVEPYLTWKYRWRCYGSMWKTWTVIIVFGDNLRERLNSQIFRPSNVSPIISTKIFHLWQSYK